MPRTRRPPAHASRPLRSLRLGLAIALPLALGGPAPYAAAHPGRAAPPVVVAWHPDRARPDLRWDIAPLVGVLMGAAVGEAGASPPVTCRGMGTWWRSPVSPVLVRRGFDPPAQPWLPGHRGVDLASVAGDEVLAPAPGRIGFRGTVNGVGIVTVLHPDGLRSTVQPVTGGLPAGTPVTAGTVVARVAPGPSHCTPGSCVHWGVLCGDTYLDPMSLLGTVQLLPYAS